MNKGDRNTLCGLCFVCFVSVVILVVLRGCNLFERFDGLSPAIYNRCNQNEIILDGRSVPIAITQQSSNQLLPRAPQNTSQQTLLPQ